MSIVASLNKDAKLLGKNDAEYYQILKWLSLTNSDFLANITVAFQTVSGKIPFNKKSLQTANEKSDAIAAVFEARLAEYTFLVGERISLADLYAASAIIRGFENLWGDEWRAAHPNIVRWWKTVVAHPALAETFANFKFIAKPVEFTPPKKEKADKPKAAKADKPKAAPKPAADDEADAAPVEEKKPKHPLELLGKATNFNLDEWKRTYSNEETRETALPWFWEHYDPTEWSLWRFDYLYNDELTLTFMSNNLVGGFFNRLQGSAKYLFGSGIVYGENNNNGIVGVFLVRGQEHEPAFNVAPDWESYKFTKLDATKPEDKTFVEDIFAWDKPIEINGETREVADGKVFK
jgi:elongation factor 1-gamma